jgi:hypothetical protein
MLSPEPHFPVEGVMVLPKSYLPYWSNQYWTYVDPGSVIPLTSEYSLSVLRHAMGFEIVTETGNVSIDDLKLTRCELANFESMRSVPMKQQAHRLEDAERPTLQNLRNRNIHIFAGSFHGKSTFVKSNPLSAEAEMEPDTFAKRYPDKSDLITSIATYNDLDRHSDYEDHAELYESISQRLVESDIQITVSHLNKEILDKAIESGRRIAYIAGDFLTINKRMEKYWEDTDDHFNVASRSIAAMGYFQQLHLLNIRGPKYLSFEEAIAGLSIGADHVELPFSRIGDGGINNS